MRFLRLLTVTTVACLAAVGLASPANAGLTTFCDGTASDVTVPGDLVVAAGRSCELTGVTIAGDTTVRASANLLLTNSTLGGELLVRSDGFATATGSTLAGVLRLRGAAGAYTEDSELASAVNARNAGFYYSLATAHSGDVVSRQGETFVESGWITGQLRTTGDRFTDLTDTVIEGRLRVASPADGTTICTSEIDGPASVVGSGGPVRIGTTAPGSGCGPVVFADRVAVSGNTASAVIANAVIRANLACANNIPNPTGEHNRVRGNATGQCRSLAPATGAVLSTRTDITTAIERRTGVINEIENLTRAGHTAALNSGLAFD